MQLYDVNVDAPLHSRHNFLDPAYGRHWLDETTARDPERSSVIDAFVGEVAALNFQRFEGPLI